MFVCATCGYKLKTLKKYDIHLRLHRNTAGIVFECLRMNCINCKQSFSTYKKFKNHVFKNHKNLSLKKTLTLWYVIQ